MANTEVGTAWVTIIPSAKGFAKELQKEIAKEFKGSNLDKLIADALGNTRVRLPVEPVVDKPEDLDPVKVPVEPDRTSLTELQETVRQATDDVKAWVAVGPDGTTFGRDVQDIVDRTEDQVSAQIDVDVDVDTEPAGEAGYERSLRSMVAAVARRVRATIHADVVVDNPNVHIDVDTSRGIGERVGAEAGKGFLKSFVNGVASTLNTSPLILGLGIAIGVALLPAITSAITGGLLGGAGLGLIGLGALILADEPEVKRAATQLALTTVSVFKDAASPLIEPFVEALEMLRWAVIRWGPQFGEMFELIAPAILPLTEGLIGFVSNVLPGIVELIREATPFLISLANELPRLGEYIGAFFKVIDGGGPEASLFFSDLITVVGGLVLAIGAIIRVFTELYPYFRVITGLGGLLGMINAVWNARDAVVEFGHKVKDTFDRAVDLVTAAFQSMRNEPEMWVKFILGIPGRILRGLGDLDDLLWGAGRSIMKGLIDGLKSMVGPLENTLGWITDMIPAWKGPEDKDRVLLVPAGTAIMGGLIRGIHGERAALEAELGSVTSLIADTPLTSPSAGFAASAPSTPPPALLGWAPGATGDPLLDAIQDLIRVQTGGNVQARLGTS